MTIKELKIRIKGVKSIKKITKAMKMVSASKLRVIQEKLGFATKYYSVINEIIFKSNIKLENRDSNLNIFLLIMADRGLCGSHSVGICKYYLGLNEEIIKKSGLITIGSKSKELLGFEKSKNIRLKFINIFKKGFYFNELINISNKLFKLFLMKKTKSLEIVSNNYISSVKTEIFKYILNISNINIKKTNFEKDEKGLVFFFLSSLLYYCVCSSKASEESIRMQSMDNATDSANELLDNLTKLYNMSRQVRITTELIEIVSGAESLKQGKN